jgi:large subunit ribosomal protein L23
MGAEGGAGVNLNPYDILRRPIITEKNTYLMERGQYTFEVARDANKPQIKAAVETAFPNVKVVAVNTMIMPYKTRRRGRIVGRLPAWKKAVVTRRAGDRIELFEGV